MSTSNRKGSNPQRDHHVVPRYYLSGFAIPKDKSFIWAYKKSVGYNPPKAPRNPSKLSIKKNAGIVRDFYAHFPTGSSPDYDSIEKLLKEQEDSALPVLRKIRNFEVIDETEKAAFASYICHMIRRSEFARNFVRGVVNPLIDEFKQNGTIKNIVASALEAKIQRLRGQGVQSDDIARIANIEDVTEQVTAILRADPNSYKEAHLFMQRKQFSKLHEHLVEMSWVFIRSPEDEYFITSDNPICSTGTKSENNGLIFPISLNLCLMIFRGGEGPIRFQQFDSNAVQTINAITARRCISYFFASENNATLMP